MIKMVPYKGIFAGKRRQYMPAKPTKWGIKFFVRAGISGMVYNIIMYNGKDTLQSHHLDADETHMGISSAIVLALVKSVNTENIVLGFDNWFTSTELLHILGSKYKINAIGTIRAPRAKAKIQKGKMKRGDFRELIDATHNLSLVNWMDNKEVLLISNFTGSTPVGKASRYDKTEKKRIDITCPNIVKSYNAVMGGVDLADMLISLNRIKFRSKKWYNRIFAQLLDIALNNAWILYKREYKALLDDNKFKPIKEFRIDIAKALLAVADSKQVAVG